MNDTLLIPVATVQPDLVTQTGTVVYVPLASEKSYGIVKAGEGVVIERGVVSLNKQYVEDMIDANKWVSYGFQQNLTEEEKGLARHNIGAGDNDFTGSYYDVTQKPTITTTNTEKLIPIDNEIIVDDIQLHKISKTGSFDDLNDVPHETLGFAEQERQKSKNLFPVETVSGTGARAIKFPETLPAGIYTLSTIATSSSTDTGCLVEVYYNGDWVGVFIITKDNTRKSATRIITSPFNELRFYGGASYIQDATFSFDKVQLEEGTRATDYQSYNGQITHNGDKPVVFAESERQKSKNLFDKNSVLKGYEIRGDSLEISPLSGYYVSNLINVNGLSSVYLSSTSKTVGRINSFYDDTYRAIGSYSKISGIIPIPRNAVYMRFNGLLEELDNDIQVEAGDVATDYQSYHGEITHNGDASVVFAESERIKTLNLCNNEMFEWGDIVGQGTVEQESYTIIRTKNYIPVKPNTQYFIGVGLTAESIGLKYYSDKQLSSAVGTRDVSSSQVITIPDGCHYLRIASKLSDVSVDITKQQYYLYEGTTDYGYLEYNGAIVHEKDIERVEVLYDKENGKTTLGGLDYGGGIRGGQTISNLDLSKYKFLRFDIVLGNSITGMLNLSLKTIAPTSNTNYNKYWTRGRFGVESNNNNVYISAISVNKDKNTISYELTGFFTYTDNLFTDRNNNGEYFISRIEGVY